MTGDRTLMFVPLDVLFASLQVVCLDAGHMKGGWKGVVYVLSMKDSNNRIIHVATVLADKENMSNYKFLLEETCKNEQMARLLKSDKITFFIDGHKGSPPALEAVCPYARWNMCVRHLLTTKNMKKMGAVSFELSAPVCVWVWLCFPYPFFGESPSDEGETCA